MNKVAVITGGAKGIGASIVKQLSNEGYSVVFTYNKSEEQALKLKDLLLLNNKNVDLFKCDISKSEEVTALANFVINKYKKIDLLVNNAGISLTNFFDTTTNEQWHEIINVNLSGTFYTCREFSKLMISQKSGKIINISSIWGQVGASMEVAYSASKAGVIGLTKALAKELAPSKITVNCIAPGATNTDMMRIYDKKTIDCVIEDIPLKRLCNPEEIAQCVSYLASDSANFITGQTISINGGEVI